MVGCAPELGGFSLRLALFLRLSPSGRATTFNAPSYEVGFDGQDGLERMCNGAVLLMELPQDLATRRDTPHDPVERNLEEIRYFQKMLDARCPLLVTGGCGGF